MPTPEAIEIANRALNPTSEKLSISHASTEYDLDKGKHNLENYVCGVYLLNVCIIQVKHLNWIFYIDFTQRLNSENSPLL